MDKSKQSHKCWKDHRITEWKKLDRTSEEHLVQCPYTKQSLLGQATRDYIQSAFEYVQGCRLHTLPVPHSEEKKKKKGLLMFKENSLHFSCCPLPIFQSLGTTEKILAESSLIPPSIHKEVSGRFYLCVWTVLGPHPLPVGEMLQSLHLRERL